MKIPLETHPDSEILASGKCSRYLTANRETNNFSTNLWYLTRVAGRFAKRFRLEVFSCLEEIGNIWVFDSSARLPVLKNADPLLTHDSRFLIYSLCYLFGLHESLSAILSWTKSMTLTTRCWVSRSLEQNFTITYEASQGGMVVWATQVKPE
jgi:hypothetical protein